MTTIQLIKFAFVPGSAEIFEQVMINEDNFRWVGVAQTVNEATSDILLGLTLISISIISAIACEEDVSMSQHLCILIIMSFGVCVGFDGSSRLRDLIELVSKVDNKAWREF